MFLGFDFYGAGNIGDDLMLQGFLECARPRHNAIPDHHFACMIPRKPDSQRLRFPEVDWQHAQALQREAAIRGSRAWIGVGDTPFQTTSGPWLMDAILRDIATTADAIPMHMVGVGAEKEAFSEPRKVGKIVESMRHISTRDDFSAGLLMENFPAYRDRISVGADLAHVALRTVFEAVAPGAPIFDLAVTYYAERSSGVELGQVKKFLVEMAKSNQVIFVGNETRRGIGAEYDLYRSMFLGLRNLFSRSDVDLYLPDYRGGSILDLVSHFTRYKVVLSSRYHSILAAAWAGCRVTALGRGSKIGAVARELDIPLVEGALDVSKLHGGYQAARAVSRENLLRLAAKAERSVVNTLALVDAGPE